MEWLLGILAAIVAGAIAYLFAERRARAVVAQAQTDVAVARQQVQSLEQQLSGAKVEAESARHQLSSSQQQQAGMTAELRAAEENLLEQKRLLDEAQSKLKDAFASVSAEALAKNNVAFLALAQQKFATLSTEATGTLDERKAQIEGLLKPMQEMLGNYQLRLADVEKSRVESYSMLREQLGTLAETQRTLHVQTNQLVSALRRPQTRGQWGEITLRRLVELAGLSNRCDFFEQSSITTEDGRLRPDMVVRLPADRTVIIDCKAPLDAFLDAAACTDEDVRRTHMARHSQQVRARARELSGKSYGSQFKNSLDYVIMFLPGEAFLYAALENDPSLIEDCLKNSVIVATPTTLIALLKAIEFGWRQEAIAENAEAIRKHGTDLYDRIATLAEHFAKLGSNLESAVDSYNKTIGSLEARVLVTARNISALGARSDKEICEIEPVEKQTRPFGSAIGSQASTLP